MSKINSLPGLLVFAVLICSSCKQKAEDKSTKSLFEKQESSSTPSHDSIPRFAVYSSPDYGNTWQPMSKGLPDSLQATCLTKVGHELLLATENAGLFITQNNKTSWKDISSGLAVKKINTLYVNGDEVYIGLFHEGVTMWKLKSAYWNSYNSNLPNRNVEAILKVKDELVIGTDMGIFKSSGHMETWNGKYIGERVASLAAAGDTLYAGTVKGILMSKDGGEHWAYVQQHGIVHKLIIIDKIIYAMYSGGDFFSSDNWGRTWKQIDYSPKENSHVYTIIQDDGQFLMSNLYGVFRSANADLKWQLIYPVDNRAFLDLAEDNLILYGATANSR